MKALLLITLLSCLVLSVLSWEKEDYEIFDLVSAIEASEGKGTTFYSWLDVSPKATSNEIAKAYRKKSMVMHPDKNPDVKGIQERFARLGVVSQILRNSESRKRYDFFYKNGVPKWKGTGYMYSRFRPGLGTVLTFLTLLTSLLQYTVQRLNHKRDMERIDRLVKSARAVAWGPKGIPIDGKRKVRVPLSGNLQEDEGRGRMVELMVEKDQVFLIGDELHPLDSALEPKPSIKTTWAVALIITAFSRLISLIKPQSSSLSSTSAEVPTTTTSTTKPKSTPKPKSRTASEAEEDTTDADVIDSDEASDAVENVKGGGNVRPAAMKAGGRRRKVAAGKKR